MRDNAVLQDQLSITSKALDRHKLENMQLEAELGRAHENLKSFDALRDQCCALRRPVLR